MPADPGQPWPALAQVARRRIGNIDVAVLSEADAIALLTAAAEAAEPRLATFCNAHSVNLAADDHDLAAVMNGSLVLNDGIGLDLASRALYGAAFPDNLAGTDFCPRLLDAAEPLRIFLLGSEPGVANRAADRIAARFPKHRVVGTRDGFFGEAEAAEVAGQIAASGANILFVGMGQPRQERWAGRYFSSIPALTICVGAWIDFTAGVVPRAPDVMRRLRMEWVYRLALEPRRLMRRYLIGNPLFIARIALQRRQVRRRR